MSAAADRDIAFDVIASGVAGIWENAERSYADAEPPELRHRLVLTRVAGELWAMGLIMGRDYPDLADRFITATTFEEASGASPLSRSALSMRDALLRSAA